MQSPRYRTVLFDLDVLCTGWSEKDLQAAGPDSVLDRFSDGAPVTR